MDIRYMCDYIKDSVSAIDAAEAMGIRMDYHHRTPCPFHGGQHNNLKLYDGDRGYYCFVCHAYGNVIDLVEKVQDCKFMDAVRWLNETFRLGLDVEEGSFRNRLAQARRNARPSDRDTHEQRLERARNGAVPSDRISSRERAERLKGTKHGGGNNDQANG